MSLVAVWVWCLAWVQTAAAADVHGAPVTPCAAEGGAPFVAWAPGAAARGAWRACATVELADEPVVATVTDADGTSSFSPLDDLVGLHVGGGYGFGRVGVAVDLPLWLASTNAGEANGFAPGDLRVYAPVAILRPTPERGLGFDVVLEVVAPTGDDTLLLGAGGTGVGGHLVLGGDAGRFAGTADLGVGYGGGGTLTGLDTRLWTRLALAGEWRPTARFSAGVEAWFQAAPLAGAAFLEASPGEALMRVGTTFGPGVTLGLAGGTAITPGVGAADTRLYLRVGIAQAPARPAARAVTEAPPPPPAPGPFDVVVTVADPAGQPLDAQLAWTGDGAPAPTRTGTDGEARNTLAPGHFVLEVSREGFGTQRRDFSLEPDRFRPERVAVVLHPVVGEATLRLDVEDAEGRKVDDARVQVDGKSFGTTSTGGNLEIDGVAAGEHQLAVRHPDFRERGALAVVVPHAPGESARVVLERPPGSVKVITRGPAGPVADARVRFSGPEDVAPQDIGADGERTFTLLPGHWILMASAQDLGTQEREFEVEAGKTALVLLEVRMRQGEAGPGRLVVRVVDPSGAPVDGAEVLVDGVSAGRTANEGSLTLADLRPGERKVEVRAPRFRAAEARTVELATGTRELVVPLAWRPGQLHLVARGVEGAMVDARVRFSGPEELPPTNLGPDGEAWFELAPGTWNLAIASATYGVQEREVVVEPDDVALVDVVAGLLSADGDAVLALRVLDDQRQPLAGARLVLDRRSVGTTASGGRAEIGSLRAGKHELVVEADGLKGRTSVLTLSGGRTELEVRLDALARRVDVRASGPDGPARDALVRGYGAEVLPPSPVDGDGRRELLLDPGPWTLVAVSERLGIAETDVDVKKGRDPQAVDLALRPPPPSVGALLVEVVDPAGRPVPGAIVKIDGVAMEGGPTGVVLVPEHAPGPAAVSAAAPGFLASATESVSVQPGVQTRRVRLEWAPREVRVSVRDEAGAVVDAEVRVFGPGRAEPVRSGAGAASFTLRPGTWQVVASAKGYGPWRRDLELTAGQGTVAVDAVLAAEKVEVTKTSVVIREQVRFAFDKADIEEGSYPLLEQVASTLLLHPEIQRIEVQGHTDNRGTEVYNLDLSQRRAEAVRAYLVRRGVEPARVDARGYGTSHPLVSNESEAGRAKNRRVQFEIVANAP